MDADENIYKHLVSVAKSLPDGDEKNVFSFKNYFLMECLERSKYTCKLPQNIFGPNQRCSYCCTAWNEQNFTYKMKNKPTKSMKRKLVKLVNSWNKSVAEINKAKQLLTGQKMIIKCSVCQKITNVILPKPPKFKPPSKLKNKKIIEEQQPQIIPVQNIIPSKIKNESVSDKKNNPVSKPEHPPVKKVPISQSKRKRQKDKFAGLCADACRTSMAASSNAKKESNVNKNNPLNLFLKSTR